MLKRIILYFTGIFLMSIGVASCVWGGLGLAPVDTVPYVVSQIFQADLGLCTTAVFFGYILLQLVLLRKRFPLKNFLQIIVATIQGSFISVINQFFHNYMPECTNYFMQLLFFVFGIAVIGFGIFLYIETEIISLPAEGVALALETISGKPMSTMKIFFDWFLVLVAFVLSLCFLHGIQGIREGTILAAFGVGLFIKLYTKLFQKPVRTFLGKH